MPGSPSLTTDGPAVRRDLALATWGLFVGLALLMLAAGLFGTALGVRSERVGLPTAISSLISAAYYIGFLVGSRLTLRSLGRVGHIRVYAALASTLAAGMVAVGITGLAGWWVVLRLLTGLCTAGLYVVAESWLNDLATNENRGRLLAVYGVVTILFFGMGQILLAAVEGRLVMAFAVAGILTSLAVAPVALSEDAVAPKVERTSHVSLRDLARTVPTGVYSCLLIGVAHGAMTGMAAIYATRVGMRASAIGLFVALPSIGSVILQWPISRASDDLDRRVVGFAAAVGAIGAGATLVVLEPGHPAAFLCMAGLGGLSYPLYSIAAAYTNDWIEPAHLNAAASQLVTLYGMGAVAGPFVAAGTMIAFGPDGFFWALVGLHAVIAAYLFYRILAWRSPIAKRPWREVSLPARAFFVPATIIAMGVRRRRQRREHPPEE
ncbi:MAG: MFS transporter [Ilumatobacteraceae bacterium]|nr:MFS transporter [Ilumatobacter sp.]